MIWYFFILLILFLFGIDMLVLHKKGSVNSHKKATLETCLWVTIALSFSFAIYWSYKIGFVNNINNLTPSGAVVKYITGYLIELSLSVDNLFVIAVIFTSYNIPVKYQHRALFWGIIGAIFFRGIMIGVGVSLIRSISWITYVFGALLLFTAFKILDKEEEEKSTSIMEEKIAKYFNYVPTLHGEQFFIFKDGVRYVTPLFAALVMIELTDLLFALDSIPAILAVTTDPFLVFSSNIFAVLGLRSMYFF